MLLILSILVLLTLASSKDLPLTVHLGTRSMGRIKYEDGEVILYQNRFKSTDIFFTPFPRVDSDNSECHENPLSGYVELSLSVRLYTPQLIQTIQAHLKHRFSTLCAGNETCDVSLLPMNAIRLVQKGRLTERARKMYTINDEWYSNTLSLQSFNFILYMTNMSVCEDYRSSIIKRCHMPNFELHYSLHSEKTVERQVEITTEQVIETSMYNQIRSQLSTSDTVVLTGDDYKRLISEISDKMIIKLRVQEGFDSQIQDLISLDKLLEQQQLSKRVHLKKMDDQLWDSLYWTKDLTRPDRLAKIMNKIVRKNATTDSHFIYDRQAAKNSYKLGLTQHDIDRFEQLDKHLATNADFSSLFNSQSKNIKVVKIGFGMSGGDSNDRGPQSNGSEDNQALVDLTHNKKIDVDHLNMTNIEVNNDTQYLLSRDDVKNYLNELSDHIYLESDLILPKPIDVHLIKLNNLRTETKLLSHTVLVRSRKNVHVLPLRCPLRKSNTSVDNTKNWYLSLENKASQPTDLLSEIKDQLSQMKEQISKSVTESEQRSSERLVEIERNCSTKIDELNSRFIAAQHTEGSVDQKRMELERRVVSVEKTLACHTKWNQHGITVAGGNGKGTQLNQLDFPHNTFIDDDQTIYIADCGNHRIVKWTPNAISGQIVAGGNGAGHQTNQLNCPKDVIVDKEDNSLIICDANNKRIMRWSLGNYTTNGKIIIENIHCYGLKMDKNESLYVSDIEQDAVKRWKKGEKNGIVVAGGNGKGSNLNQLNFPTYMFIDDDYSLYVSDRHNHRVMKWLKDAKEGIVVAGGNGQGNSLTQLNNLHGIIVGQLDQIYVSDFLNDRVMCWCKGAKEGMLVVGGNGEGQKSNQLKHPVGITFDRQENLYITDYENHRIQKFKII